MPGVEIHANILSTIRSGSYILPVSSSTIFTITLVIALFAQLLAHSLRQPAVRALITLVILGLFFVITQWIFVEHLTYIAALKPVCALFILSTIFIVYDFTLEQHERNRVRSYLDRYVTRNVADVILNDRGDFEESLKGKRSEVCIFFSDIRGFTTLSENLDPEELVALLNEYFNPMVDIVLKADGTLQKFIGDAIMAVWGDTLHMSEEDKAVKAVKASLEMLEALASLNSSITARGYAPLGIGIGLNYGEAIVGNIGHAQRMEFTVLGDAVNLAARLEGATKVYHQQILVGESVYKLAGNKIAFRFVANLLVKGKETAVPVYTPITEQSKMTAVARDWLATYETAIQHFFDRDFEAARKAFEIANEALGNEDYICQSYIKKCIVFKQNPPPSDWDGTDKLTTK
jgi:adenylate cyclase